MATQLTYDEQMQEQSAARIMQERYDMALQPWDRRAPSPVLGQSYDNYRRETLKQMKRLLPDDHKLRNVQINGMETSVLNVFEPQIMSACRQEAYNPLTVPLGEYRRVTELDQNGMKIVKYIGQRSFTDDFKRPCRRVKSFNTSSGKVVYTDPNGNILR